MIYWRCRCGAREYWESGFPPADCNACEKCGTTLATGPEGHREPVPHEWEQRFNPRTGEPDRRTCRRCHSSERIPDAL